MMKTFTENGDSRYGCTLAGGIVITFAKEILSIITGG